jgi:predicted chitinase
MFITLDDLRALAPRGKTAYLSAVADAANEHFPLYGITTPLRVAHFFAQCAEECDGFKTMEEYASGSAYEGRKDLGNIKPGDGKRFKGRGVLQITGRANYRAMGQKLNIDLEQHPEKAAEPATAIQIACEYWRSHGLNALADKNDLLTITKRINGGTNGLPSRRAYFNTAWRLWGDKDETPKAPKSIITSKTTAAATAVGGISVAKTVIEQSQDAKDTVSSAGQLLGFADGQALLIGAGVIIVGLLAFIVYDRWKKLKTEGV